jgi:Rieske Fe-S protein
MATRNPHLPLRRQFARRILGLLLGLPLIGGAAAMLRSEIAREQPPDVPIPADVPVGLSIVDAVVIRREAGGGLHAFSARCTHLGCRIDRVIGDQAVCPCHGSRYNADGSVAAGPATRPLRRLSVDPDPAGGGWTARAT